MRTEYFRENTDSNYFKVTTKTHGHFEVAFQSSELEAYSYIEYF